MSSIPTRRTTRVTRSMKDSENATARPARATTRVKVLASASAQTTSVTTRATAPTAASKAKAVVNETEGNVGKRKREALVEVTGVNKTKASGVKGKEKEVAGTSGTVAKGSTTTTQRVLRRAGSAVPSATVRTAKVLSSSKDASEAKPTVVAKKRDPVEGRPPQRTITARVYRDSEAVVEETIKLDDDEGESKRAFKKRHMSIVAEEIHVETHNDSQAEADKIAAELVKVDVEVDLKFEAEPELWDDLDADDWDDPLMVSEYVADVCKYWKEVELATLPKADYMNRQAEINWDHRGILVDWILQVHARFNLLPESLFLTVNLLDRFLAARPISLNKLQLVGLACFFIATKFEETCAPSVNEIVFLSDNQYAVGDVLKAETYILRVLDWDLRCPGPMSWLRRGSKADDCESTARTVAKYLMEIGCLERQLIGVVPSLIAAAALWLGRLAVGREEWTHNLEHYTTFSEKEILPTATIMLEYVLTNPIQHESLYKKYAHKKYLKCSAYMRQWALERWPENTDIHLERDLDRIKAEIRKWNRELAEEAAEEAAGARG